jgi:glucosyl-3-phosphoglycerate synthase
MADFYQTGVITTLHRLGKRDGAAIEAELREFARHKPISLLLPSLYQEIEGPALPRIVEILSSVDYVHDLVVSLSGADARQFARARKFFGAMPFRTRLLWNDGPRVEALFDELEREGIPAGPPGKGRAVWMGFGLVLAEEAVRAIALHDCDVLTYSREMLARLCYPLMNPSFAYEYAKGYYARISDRLHGRVTRLLVTPLVRTLQKLANHHPFLFFLDSFRYPLAGEFALSVELARTVRIPSDWGLEVGFLAEVYRNYSPRRVCEVDLLDAYDHKHQEISAEDPTKGLTKMATDIAKSIFRTLASEGIPLHEGFFRALRAAYLRAAEDQIRRYNDDATINGLVYARHEEGKTVEAFLIALDLASKQVLEDPLGTPLIPNWNRVTSAIPDFPARLWKAVEEDNR